MTQARKARPSIVVAIAYRRPPRIRSSAGPMRGARSANGTIVTSSEVATRSRAAVAETEKKSVPASAVTMIVSPAVETNPSSDIRARPDSPAPLACVHRRAPRQIARAPRPLARAVRTRSAPVAGGSGAAMATSSPRGRVGVIRSGVRPSTAMSNNRPVPPTSVDDSGTAPATRPRGSRTARAGEPDAVLAAAVDLARAAAEEDAARRTVGEHLGVTLEGERLVTHSFASLDVGYRGWRWAVTLARAPRSRHATVCEVVLLPGADAVLAPAWVPWQDRIAPGDLGPADVLAYRSDDPYLAAGFTVTDEDDEDHQQLWELGLGRIRVLSLEGRNAAADRWYHGDRGPTGEEALHAAAPCSTCGYFVPVSGGLRRAFGICANEWSPSDGRVVSTDHGCGAHSETDVEVPVPEPLPEPILDETGAEAVALPPRGTPEAQPSDAGA